jgi:hypothetical protein
MAWKKSALKHSQTFSCASIEFMDMLLMTRCEAKAFFGLMNVAFAGDDPEVDFEREPWHNYLRNAHARRICGK